MESYKPYEDYKETCKFRITALSFAFTCENEGIDDFVALVEKTKEIRISLLETTFFKEKVFILRPISLDETKTYKVRNIYFCIRNVPQKNIYAFIAETKKEDTIIKPSISIRKGVKWLVFKVIVLKEETK
ncbi:MAG: hypothetical protein PHG24_02755 [Candidatus Pacebacteria bacterium]|nr:hypothetical protein [Candidatus Paceibacterota bacterium]